MRSTSRSPSPRMTAVAGPSNVQHREGRAPFSNRCTHGARQQQQQPRRSKQERKDKAVSAPRDDSNESGGDGDGDGNSVSTQTRESGAAASASENTTKAGVVNGFAVSMDMDSNGISFGDFAFDDVDCRWWIVWTAAKDTGTTAASGRVIANTTTAEEAVTTSWTSIHRSKPSPVSITLGLLSCE
jgi:hypothetical protein